MMKKSYCVHFAVTTALFLLFALFTAALFYVDVQPIGPQGSPVGCATINGAAARLLGVHPLLYQITDWLGVVALLLAMGFAALGLCQLIRRKSLLQVDSGILLLGCFYVLVAAAYVFFEQFPVNFRPVLIQGRLEASYPSSTTLLVLCVTVTAMLQFRRLIKHKTARKTVQILSASFLAVAVAGRLLSGVHWLTDIFGGILLGAWLIMLYISADGYLAARRSD